MPALLVALPSPPCLSSSKCIDPISRSDSRFSVLLARRHLRPWETRDRRYRRHGTSSSFQPALPAGRMSQPGGFSFDLCKRNEFLEARGMTGPGFTKTGTTIAGVIFKDGVVLGADTRSTAGTTVADKNCEKIHYIAPNIYCCGAGTAADTENVTGMVASQLELHRYATGTQSRVITAMTLLKSHLFRYQGHVSAALVLGGVDFRGPHLFTVYPHGSTDSLPFCTMGSGSLNAMAVFEAGYKDDMSKEEAMELVARAIRSGVLNDLGSGSNVDLCVITKEGVEYKRNYEYLQGKTYERQFPQRFAAGSVPVVRERVFDICRAVAVVEGEPMEMEA